ncbi:MAG TPA: ABC transporter permease [Micromonosporaceae bacterium]|nr:ABC transporter permease [Micromonosporaceae bacterium]
MAHPTVAVLEYQLVGYRRTWRASVTSSFVLPMLTVLSFGVGVGAYVDGGVGGVPYLDYLMPGLIASTAFQVAVGDSTWPVLGQLKWIRTYHAQVATPVRVGDVVAGHLAFVGFRVLVTGLAFLLVAAVFGTLHSVWVLAILPVCLLLGLAGAAPAMAYSARVPTDSFLVMLFRFWLIPMTLFAGVFFPVDSLPVALRWLAYASPLWHGVDLCRSASLGVPPDWSVTGHLAYLSAWALGGWWVAHRVFRRKLVG